jgi:hypothetical protein
MKNLIFLLLIFLIGFNYSTAQKKVAHGSTNTTRELNKIVEVNGKKINIDSVDIDTMSTKEYCQLIKNATIPQARYLAQKHCEKWKKDFLKAKADSSINFEKEFKAINETKCNIGNGVDYQPIYKLILTEALSHGTQKQKVKALKLYKKLEKIFYKRGHNFNLDLGYKTERHAKTACFFYL